MSIMLLIASVIAIITFCIHTFVGGKDVAAPLLADRGLPPASKWLNYYCWHITTVLLLFLAAALAWSAIIPGQISLVVFTSSLTAVLSVLSGWVAIKASINPFRFPSTTLFAVISIICWTSLFI